MNGLSPQSLARIAGGLYLVNIVGGAFAIGVVPGMLLVVGDPAATAHNVASNEVLYRLGLAVHVVVVLTNVPIALIFYELFKVVDRRVAVLVAFFTLVATAIEAAGLLNQFSPLIALSTVTLPGAQAQSVTYVSLQSAATGYAVSTIFYAGYDLAIGYLILRSTFFPRAIGVLMAVDGIGYLTYSFAQVIAPGFAAHLVPWVQLPVLPAEGSLCLWLLIAGVNVGRWNAMEVGRA